MVFGCLDMDYNVDDIVLDYVIYRCRSGVGAGKTRCSEAPLTGPINLCRSLFWSLLLLRR